ncbi:hypothetical protein ACFL1F_00440 [Chlamydiota bacterium]
MKILYVTFSDPYSFPGVFRKEREFCRACNEFAGKTGNDFKGIDFVLVDGNEKKGLAVPGDSNPDYFSIKEVTSKKYMFFSHIKFIRRFFRIRPLFRAAYDEICLFNPEIVVFRYNNFSIPGMLNPKKVIKDCIFITEHQSKELSELPRFFIDRMFMYPFEKNKLKKYLATVDGIIGVTSEIVSYHMELTNRMINSYVFTNGITVSNYPLKLVPAFTGDELKILFVSSCIEPWHGLDRFLQGIANYKGPVRIKLGIVATVPKYIEKLIKSLRIKDKVIIYGRKFGESLDELFNEYHIALASLAFHRVGLNHASCLKVREYTARGIPFLVSGIDDDILKQVDWCLQASSDDKPIGMEKVIAFANRISCDFEKIKNEMRDYAFERMDNKSKVEGLFGFFKKLIQERDI